MIRYYSQKDPEARLFLEKASRYVQQAENLKMPYWIFVEGSDPIGLMAVGKEPIKLLASPGTPMAIVQLIDWKLGTQIIESFATEALRLARETGAEYASATFPYEQAEPINLFKMLSFKEFDDCYRMVCQLDRTYEPSDALKFREIKREEMRGFIKVAHEFLLGSPDITLTKALEHFLELPDGFLDFYHSQEKFYLAEKDEQTIGVLNLNLGRSLVSNIGVDPLQRGKGYGRQIMLYGLQQMKKSGCTQAYLRVHVANSPAIHLYESLGFVKSERYKTLIWRK